MLEDNINNSIKKNEKVYIVKNRFRYDEMKMKKK